MRIIRANEVTAMLHDPVDRETLDAARAIVEDVRERGEKAVREHAEKFGDIDAGAKLVYTPADMDAALESLPAADRELLTRVAARIRQFAVLQRDSLAPLRAPIPGGEAGHNIAPVESAGCYGPGGGFPLPSSVLMTAVTARAAGVENVIVASPKPQPITLAAAAVAGANLFLAAGGAHGIAAMAFGAVEGIAACDVLVGPGSKWVTAAKQILSGRVGIDMLAGPSELAIIADDSADPETIAADLLAQAEHGYDSLPVLITHSSSLIEKTNAALVRQLKDLPTRETARASVANGYAVITKSLEESIRVCDTIAPEHLELLVENPAEIASTLKHYGGLFIGSGAAEVLGDYGAGPNHTLPTGGTARFTGGLSVFNFLRIRTWMRIDDLDAAQDLVKDARDLARLEKLEGHARSAERRLKA